MAGKIVKYDPSRSNEYTTNYETFKWSVEKTLEDNYSKIWFERDQIAPPGSILFPTTILFSETKTHYIAELVGASRVYAGLTSRVRRVESIESLLINFPSLTKADSPMFKIGGEMFCCVSQHMRRGSSSKLLLDRFPALQRIHHPTFSLEEEDGSFIKIGNGTSLILKDVFMSTELASVARCRHFLALFALPIGFAMSDFERLFEFIYMHSESVPIPGVTVLSDRSERAAIVSQFKSLFLQREVLEPTISHFLSKHPEFVKSALDAKSAIYEARLEWVEHDGSVKEKWIQPDALVERQDGTFDILDFKLAMLDKGSLTNNQRKRRRFIVDVADGIAQLANYEFYFSFGKNRDFADDKFGVTVGRPRLLLVVGNLENFFMQEVQEALRQYGPDKYSIIDYDSLATLYLTA